MRRFIIVVGCLLVASTPVLAQVAQQAGVAVGSRVRVERVNPIQADSSRRSRLTGRLTAERPDSLFVETKAGAAARSVAQADVRRLWVSRGIGGRKTKRGMAFGLIIGALTIGSASAISEAGCDDTPAATFDFSSCIGVPAAFAVGSVVGGALGTVVGAVVGQHKRYELWERVR